MDDLMVRYPMSAGSGLIAGALLLVMLAIQQIARIRAARRSTVGLAGPTHARPNRRRG